MRILDVGKLATLRAVVAHGSFSAAGAALSLTQPAVSRQVSLLERQVGTQLVRRTRQGVQATDAGRLLVEHAEAVLNRLALAESELAELIGLRRGEVRLGSFFTALVYLSAEAAAVLEARHPNLVVKDELVDRRAAFARLASGELDVAIVFEHEFEPSPAPEDIEIVPLYVDPPRVLLPANHRLARSPAIRLEDLAEDTWIVAREGSAERLVDHLLARHGLDPPRIVAGRGDEPVEAQALVAAGKGVSLAHELNVIVSKADISVRPLKSEAPARKIQAAILRAHEGAAARAVLDALREVGRLRRRRIAP